MSVAENDREMSPSTLELSDTVAAVGSGDRSARGLNDTIAAARSGDRSALGLSDAIAGARPDDPAALALARARIAGALFGSSAGFGRFRVLERLGSGGMGAVYAAYDPQLDRGVALKVVHVPERRHDAALAEAKALARLAHPNVVPVFDVGIEGDEVYIVMELVRGETLRSWVAGRPASEVLDVYRQAGAALAAAHAAGLVHRDFKPDNAIVGRDGRVRVVDFGLACEASEQRAAAGTPGYMAPEQAAGGAVSPAADQYSFCVSLGEALDDAGGPGGRPAWLAAILARGTAADPGERFASVAELLRALGRDPARLRRRRIVAGLATGAAAAAVAAAFFAGRASPAVEGLLCEGGEAEIAAAWPAAARAAALDRIAGLGAYGSELAPRLQRQLDDYARVWATGRRGACLAHARGMQSSELFDRRTLCLDRGRAAVEMVARTAARSDAADLPKLADAAASLPELAACGNSEALGLDVAPPPALVAGRVKQLQTDLARVRIAIAAGQLDEVRTWLDLILEQAREIGYQPLLAEALLVSGHLLTVAEDRDHAMPMFAEAWPVAAAARADAVAVEAWSRQARAAATSVRFAQPEARAFIEAIAKHDSCAGFPRALLHSALGTVEFARGSRVLARAAFERAREERRGATGPGVVELAVIERGLALAIDDATQRDAVFAELESRQRSALGAGHPQTLLTRYSRAISSVVGLPAAAGILNETCHGFEAYPGLQTRAATCWGRLAQLRHDLGDAAGSETALAQAFRLDAEHHHFLPDIVPTRSLWRGNSAAAIQQFTAALAAKPARPDDPWFETVDRARLTLGLMQAYRDAERPRDRQLLRKLVSTLEAMAREHPATDLDRLLAHARAELAYSGHTAETIAAGRAALAWWRSVGASADDAARLERWITAVPDSPR